jgi:hypothetical protein
MTTKQGIFLIKFPFQSASSFHRKALSFIAISPRSDSLDGVIIVGAAAPRPNHVSSAFVIK